MTTGASIINIFYMSVYTFLINTHDNDLSAEQKLNWKKRT